MVLEVFIVCRAHAALRFAYPGDLDRGLFPSLFHCTFLSIRYGLPSVQAQKCYPPNISQIKSDRETETAHDLPIRLQRNTVLEERECVEKDVTLSG